MLAARSTSYFEYLLKCEKLFGDTDAATCTRQYDAVNKYLDAIGWGGRGTDVLT